MRIVIIIFLICIFGVTFSSFRPGGENDSSTDSGSSNTCLHCHDGIEEIKDPDSYMMETIAEIAEEAGFAGNSCIVCHGGNPETTDKTLAHKGSIPYFLEDDGPKDFYPDPGSMKQLPPAPTAAEVKENPQLAAYTYIRQECQRCHIGVKGRNKPGDYRGMGCSACHIPYSTEGYYEGNDPSISHTEPGHVLVHSLQSSRKCEVTVNDKTYSGIPIRTCVTCHNRGRRIGTSYMGLLETAYKSPFMPNGDEQEQVFTKNYLHLHADIHKDKGMLCQDCHTSLDVHSSGILAGTTLAAVEIECQDCHGTPQKYPWELPIGFSDEIAGDRPATGPARGLADEVPDYASKGTIFDMEEGYLITARGNPMPQVVKKGNEVIVYTAGGKDIVLSPLKTLLEENKLSEEAVIAMDNIDGHINHMECYTCHNTWAPQCYGCHLKVDYSKNAFRTDWTADGNDHNVNGLSADARGEANNHLIPGKVEEQRSYILFEDPAMAVNGEHRISNCIPGCNTTITVISEDNEPLLLNHIFRIPDVEGAGAEGQLASDMAIVHPHTVSKRARSCESCHNDPKALGYGIENGTIIADPSKPYDIDLTTAEGVVLAKKSQAQINAIPNLDHDWSRFVSEEGKQLQTVGHHFTGERPLNNEERALISREGVCSSCHKSIPDNDLAVSLLSHVREMADIPVSNDMHTTLLNRSIILTAWIEIVVPVVIVLVVILLIWRWRRRR